ncbi:hypothetical protein ABLN67_12325, partial [Mycobacterium tuberculosis]
YYFVRFIEFGCLTVSIYRREWSFRIYRETLSRFSCAAFRAFGTKPIGGPTCHGLTAAIASV